MGNPIGDTHLQHFVLQVRVDDASQTAVAESVDDDVSIRLGAGLHKQLGTCVRKQRTTCTEFDLDDIYSVPGNANIKGFGHCWLGSQTFFVLNFPVPMGMFSHGKFSKESQQLSRTTPPYSITTLVYAEFLCDHIPPAVRPTPLRQMDMGSLTFWVRAVNTKGGQAKKKSQELTRRDRKTAPSTTLPHQGIEPRVFGFEF